MFWYPERHDAIQRELFFRLGMLQPTMIMRAGVFKSNPYNERAFFEDYEILTRLAVKHKMGNMQEILLKHRCHSRQIHIVNQALFHRDLQKYRFRYFYEKYPNTPLPDYLALARVSDKQPMTSI